MKRAFDVAGALAGLLVFAPAMLLVMVAIRWLDGRPVLFRQVRLGLGRRRFEILKFRTMRDGRVTGIGQLLRGTGLDELPQFINILRGEMSAVGPRPLTEVDVVRLGWTTPRQDFRWQVCPGLTGLAQVAGCRSARQSIALDRRYVARHSLLLDLRLIAWSFAINLLGKRRVRRLLRGGRYSPSDRHPRSAPAR